MSRVARLTTLRPASSKVKLGGQLNDPLIPARVVFTEVRPEHRRAACRTQIIRDRQTCEAAENCVAGLTGSVRDIGRQVVSGELRMIEDVERLEAYLQVAPPFTSKRKILENGKVLVTNTRIPQIKPRVRSSVADPRNHECGEIDRLAALRISIQTESRLLPRQVAAGWSPEQPTAGILTRDAKGKLGRVSGR